MKHQERTSKDLASTVYRSLMEAVKDGTYPAGSRLPSENELKEKYGVSRNTVRLAISRLNTLGILETRRGDGTYVRRQGIDFMLRTATPIIALQPYDLMSILEFRKGLEVEAVRLAAQRATPENLNRLRRCFQQMRQNKDNMAAFSDADAAMHKQLAAASQNELFISMLDVVQHILTNEMQQLLIQQGTDIDSLFYHETIIRCIENRKPDEAAFLMSQHLDAVISRIQSKAQKR